MLNLQKPEEHRKGIKNLAFNKPTNVTDVWFIVTQWNSA